MARKAKKKLHRMPKLSFVDQLIYWTIFLILVLFWFGSLVLAYHLRDRIAFGDEMVLAVDEHISVLWIIVPWMTFFLITFILWVQPYTERKPIFGLRNFKYGPPAWPKEYPLFMKNKPYVFVSERKKKEQKQTAILLTIVLLVSLIPFPWSLYGRDSLQSDGGIIQYNMFGGVAREYHSGEIANLEIEAYKHSVGRHSVRKIWDLRITLTTEDGRQYHFAYYEFRDTPKGQAPNWLTGILQIKRRYRSEIITFQGTENLEQVIIDNGLSESEAELLYQLFDMA